eukprot:PhM_4_TR12230/c0_g1_i1/m.67266
MYHANSNNNTGRNPPYPSSVDGHDYYYYYTNSAGVREVPGGGGGGGVASRVPIRTVPICPHCHNPSTKYCGTTGRAHTTAVPDAWPDPIFGPPPLTSSTTTRLYDKVQSVVSSPPPYVPATSKIFSRDNYSGMPPVQMSNSNYYNNSQIRRLTHERNSEMMMSAGEGGGGGGGLLAAALSLERQKQCPEQARAASLMGGVRDQATLNQHLAQLVDAMTVVKDPRASDVAVVKSSTQTAPLAYLRLPRDVEEEDDQ